MSKSDGNSLSDLSAGASGSFTASQVRNLRLRSGNEPAAANDQQALFAAGATNAAQLLSKDCPDIPVAFHDAAPVKFDPALYQAGAKSAITLRKLNVFRAYLGFVARLHLKVSNARDVAQENADASNDLPGGTAFRVVQHRRARRPWRQRLRKSKSHQFRDGFRKYSGQARTRQ
jgi:hypothetical protein